MDNKLMIILLICIMARKILQSTLPRVNWNLLSSKNWNLLPNKNGERLRERENKYKMMNKH